MGFLFSKNNKVRFKMDSYDKDNIIVFILTGLSGIIGYIYQLCLGNIMPIEEYGLANTYISYISLGTMIVAPFSAFASKSIAENYHKNLSKMDILLQSIGGIVIKFCLLFCLFVGIAICIWGEGFRFKIAILIALLTNMLYMVLISMTQGFSNFNLYAWAGVINAFVKSVCSFWGIFRGYGIVSIFWGITIGNIVCIVLFLWPNKDYCLVKKYSFFTESNIWNELRKYYKWAFLSQLIWAFFSNGGDVIIIQKIYSNYEAGLYSVVNTLAKISLFIVSATTSVMFPKIASLKNNFREQKRYLVRTGMLGGGIASAYLLLLNFVGKNLIGMLYGYDYEKAIYLLGAVTLYAWAIAVGSIFYQFFLANGQLKGFFILTALIMICMCSVGYWGNLPINAYIWFSGLMMVLYNVGCFFLVRAEE